MTFCQAEWAIRLVDHLSTFLQHSFSGLDFNLINGRRWCANSNLRLWNGNEFRFFIFVITSQGFLECRLRCVPTGLGSARDWLALLVREVQLATVLSEGFHVRIIAECLHVLFRVGYLLGASSMSLNLINDALAAIVHIFKIIVVIVSLGNCARCFNEAINDRRGLGNDLIADHDCLLVLADHLGDFNKRIGDLLQIVENLLPFGFAVCRSRADLMAKRHQLLAGLVVATLCPVPVSVLQPGVHPARGQVRLHARVPGAQMLVCTVLETQDETLDGVDVVNGCVLACMSTASSGGVPRHHAAMLVK